MCAQVVSASSRPHGLIVARPAPLSTGSSRQEYGGGGGRRVRVPFPPPEGLPDSGIEPASPAWAGGFFTTEPPGKPCRKVVRKQKGALPEVSVTLNSR